MPRKTTLVTIEADGRDRGKTFKITEMPAAQAEKWAARLLIAMYRGGIVVPQELLGAGFAGLAQVGANVAMSGLQFADFDGLLDEMMACVTFVGDPVGHPDIVRALIPDDTEEVATRFRLRMEWFTLHTGFSMPAAGSNSTTAGSTSTTLASPATPTSPASQSVPSSPLASPPSGT